MKSIEAAEFVARIFKQSIEDAKLTGNLDIHADCSQGGICKVQVAISERISVFMLSSTEGEKVLLKEKA